MAIVDRERCVSLGTQPALQVIIELVRATEADEPYAVATRDWNRYLLRDPDGSGRYDEHELLWDESMEADLVATRDLASAGPAVERLAAAVRAFQATPGGARIARRIRDARAESRAVAVTIRSAARELYALPWELLDIDGTPLCETDDCLLSYEYPGADMRPGPAPRQSGRVLVAWAGAVPAAEHIDAICAAARAGHVPFDRRRDVLPNASPIALEQALRASTPPVAILHLLCHGGPLEGGRAFGLRLACAAEPITPARIGQLLAPHRDTLRLVVLAACLGGSPGAIDNELGSVAQAIGAAGVPAVLASRYPLTTAGSTLLTRVLYQRLLVDLGSLEQAFLCARAALRGRLPGEPVVDVDNGLDWQSLQLHGRAALGLDFRPWVVRPYRGLECYGREDARFFFGRDEERALLMQRMAAMIESRAPRFLLVAGASGAGKSSLVQAGLIGQLEDGESDPVWSTAVMRPGEGGVPAEILARRVTAYRDTAPAGAMLALVVDQLEEIFTEITARDQREAFLRELWRLASDPVSGVFVIATIRIEYMGRLGTVTMDDGVPFDHQLLTGKRYYLVRQLGPEQYERIICGAAGAAGVLIEPGLLGRLLAALRAEPGALPLLSFTLDQLWKQRTFATQEIPVPAEAGAPITMTAATGWWLTDRAYDALGGIEGALARSADALFNGLERAHRDEIRRVLVQLVHGHDDPMLATRRRGWRLAMRPDSDTEPAAARVYDEVVDTLVDARLLVQGAAEGQDGDARPGSSQPGSSRPDASRPDASWPDASWPDASWIELAHDSLIRFWPRLGEWYREARSWLEQTDELRRMADAWQLHARREGAAVNCTNEGEYLLRGHRLAHHLDMWAQHRHHIGARDQRLVQTFLDSCARAEAKRTRAQRHRLRLLIAGALAVAAVMTALAVWALAKRDEAKQQQAEAERQRAQARQERDEAKRQEEIAQDRGIAMRDALLIAGVRKLQATEPAWAMQLLAEVERPLGTRGWLELAGDLPARSRLASTLSGHDGRLTTAVFSPDGMLVLTASTDRSARLWHADGRGDPVILAGHQGEINSAEFSPDGTLVLTSSDDGTARLWRVDGRGQPVIFRGHEDVIYDASLSPDGKLLVTASQDNTARVWRLEQPDQPIARLEHDHLVLSAAFSPDSRLVLTVSPSDGAARLCRLDDLHCEVLRHRALGPDKALSLAITSAQLSPDGRFVVTRGARDSTAWIWPVHDIRHPTPLEGGHEGWITSAVFSPDSKLVVTTSHDRTARVWSVDDPDESTLLGRHEEPLSSAAFSPDGRLVVTSSEDGTAKVWRASFGNTWNVAMELQAHKGLAVSAAFSPDGQRVVTYSNSADDRTAKIWHLDERHHQVMRYPTVHSAAFGPAGVLVIAALSRDHGSVQVWHVQGKERRALLTVHQEHPLALSQDGTLLVTTSADNTARLWRVDDPDNTTELKGHTGRITSAVFSPDGTLVVTTSEDSIARVWPLDAPHRCRALEGHTGWIASAAFSPDGTRMITWSGDRTARIWRLDAPHEPPTVLGKFAQIITAAEFSPDGTRVVTASVDGIARLYRSDDFREIAVLEGHGSAITAVAFSPDGKLMVTASADNTARLWRVDDPREITVLEGHGSTVTAAAFSPDGTFVATASDDKTARIWLVDDPGQVMLLRGHRARIKAMRFSPDGMHLLTTGRDGSARLWTIGIAALQSRLRDATTDCFSPVMRQDYLGEPMDEAMRHYAACEHRHGRTPHPAKMNASMTR